jgi:hypothetical protein
MTEREIATKILQAMDLRDKTFNDESNKSIQECFDDIFEGSILGKLYCLAARSKWNETKDWCNEVLTCEALNF